MLQPLSCYHEGEGKMITLRDVSKSYDGTVKAVDNITLTVQSGKSLVFSARMVREDHNDQNDNRHPDAGSRQHSRRGP